MDGRKILKALALVFLVGLLVVLALKFYPDMKMIWGELSESENIALDAILFDAFLLILMIINYLGYRSDKMIKRRDLLVLVYDGEMSIVTPDDDLVEKYGVTIKENRGIWSTQKENLHFVLKIGQGVNVEKFGGGIVGVYNSKSVGDLGSMSQAIKQIESFVGKVGIKREKFR